MTTARVLSVVKEEDPVPYRNQLLKWTNEKILETSNSLIAQSLPRFSSMRVVYHDFIWLQADDPDVSLSVDPLQVVKDIIDGNPFIRHERYDGGEEVGLKLMTIVDLWSRHMTI